MHKEPLIFDISKGRLDDGEGIRTAVFLKGCPLRCTWCHNPESGSFAYDFMWDGSKCLLCGDCAAVCPRGLIGFDGEKLYLDKAYCDGCGKCTMSCPGGALRQIGRKYPEEELMELLLRDRVFYEASNGGVTFSGGEPLCFPEFVGKIAKRLKEQGISAAVETCGFFEYEDVQKMVLPYIDCVLYDIKIMDRQEHIKHTGVSNEKILHNFRRLSKENTGIRLIPRTPLVPGITDTEKNLRDIRRFLAENGKLSAHVLLPYHSGGIRKRELLRTGIDRDCPINI